MDSVYTQFPVTEEGLCHDVVNVQKPGVAAGERGAAVKGMSPTQWFWDLAD